MASGIPKWNWNFISSILSNKLLEFDEKKINKLIENGFKNKESSDSITQSLMKSGLKIAEQATSGTFGSMAFANKIVSSFFRKQLASELNGNQKLADYLVSKFSRKQIEKIINDNDLIKKTATAKELAKNWVPPNNKKSAQNSLDRALNTRARYMLSRIQKEDEAASERVSKIKVRRALNNGNNFIYRYIQGFQLVKSNLPTLEEFHSLDTESKMKLLDKIEEIYKNDYRTKSKRRNRVKRNLQIAPGYNWVLATDENFKVLPETLAEESDPLLANLVNEQDYIKIREQLKDELSFTNKELKLQEPSTIANPNFESQTEDIFTYNSEDYNKLPINAPYDLSGLKKLKPVDFRDRKKMKEFFRDLGTERKAKRERMIKRAEKAERNKLKPPKPSKPKTELEKRIEARKKRVPYWKSFNNNPTTSALKLAKKGYQNLAIKRVAKARKPKRAKRAARSKRWK